MKKKGRKVAVWFCRGCKMYQRRFIISPQMRAVMGMRPMAYNMDSVNQTGRCRWCGKRLLATMANSSPRLFEVSDLAIDRWSDAHPDAKLCFLTTACTAAMGLPDDCHQLTILRRFRDTYVAGLPGGENKIREYYKLAPPIVQAISACKNAPAIWKKIYHTIIAPCVDLINQGKAAEAFTLYKQRLLELQTEFLPQT